MANKLEKGVPLKFFAGHEGSQCMVRKMVIYLGTFELHNIAKEGDNREIEVNQKWDFTNVRSQSEVIETIKTHLQQHGIGLVIQTAFEAIFNLPGIKSAKNVIGGISRFSQGFFKGMVEAVGRVLPSKEDLNIESNISKIVNPMDANQLQVLKNSNSKNTDGEDVADGIQN
jgi:hypothetical protein